VKIVIELSNNFYFLIGTCSQIYQSMQRTHAVKAVHKQLNDQVDVVPNKDGAYCPLKPTLTTVIEHEVHVYLSLSSPGTL